MNEDKSIVLTLELQLRHAMLNADVNELDMLLADDLIFTNHLGNVMSKQDDINAHKTGVLNIDIIDLEDLQINFVNGVALVNVKAKIVGTYDGESADNTFRFSRVWCEDDKGQWRVYLAQSTLLMSH